MASAELVQRVVKIKYSAHFLLSDYYDNTPIQIYIEDYTSKI